MFRKSISVLLSVLLMFTLFTVSPINVDAVESDSSGVGADLISENVGSYADERWQWTDAGVQQERCTYRAWHEAYDRLGISLPLTWGNGETWAANARSDGYSVDNTPSANSIVCWSGGGWGHVAYVTGVDDNDIYIREGGINPSNSYPNYWFRDTSFSKSNQNRWGGYTLEGYIHLKNPIPDFTPVDIGTDFYGSIVNLAVNKPIKVSGGNVVCGVRNGSDEQKWRFERQGDLSYKIINVANGECLDDDNYGNADNTNIKTCGSNDSDAQRWFFRYNGAGYSLVPKCAKNLAMDLVNGDSTEGNNVAAWTFVENNGNQIYGVDHQPSFSPVDVGTDFYGSIVNLAVNKPIKVSNNNVVVGIRDGSDKQKWKFERMDDRMYKITNVATGKCLDDAGYGTTDDTNIQVVGSNNEPAQRWFFRRNGSGYSLVPKCAMNLAMDMVGGDSTEGNNIAAWTFVENNGNQIYGIDVQPSFEPQDLGDRFTASILHVDSGKAVSSNSNNNVVIQTFTGNDNQLWLFERMDDRMYKITNIAAGLCLDEDNYGTTDNTNIKVIGSNNELAQRWYLWKNGKGYSFVPKCAMNLAMDLVSGDTTDGSNLAAWTRVSGNSNQIFRITPITFLKESMVTVNDVVITSDETTVNPKVTVKVDKTTLKVNNDYSVAVTSDIANGTGTVTVTGIGNYSGTVTKLFKIKINHTTVINDFLSQKYYTEKDDIITYYLKLSPPFSVNHLNGTIYYNQEVLEPIITPYARYHAPCFDDVSFQKIEQGQIRFDLYANDQITLNNDIVVRMQFRVIKKGGESWLGNDFTDSQFTWDNLIQYGMEPHILTNQKLFVLGDTDGDGNVNIRDVTAIQRHIAELDMFTEEQLAAADTNGDGKVDITDATHLQMYLAEYGVKLG